MRTLIGSSALFAIGVAACVYVALDFFKPAPVGITTVPGSVDSVSGIYLPEHPDLAFEEPVFTDVSPKLARAAYAASDTLFKTKSNPSFNALMVHVAEVFIAAHRMQAIACTDEKGWPQGPGVAVPECVWVIPYANDWVGCMALQFAPPNVLEAFAYDDTQPRYIWTDRNYNVIAALPEGVEFLRQLNGVEKLGAQCEAALLHPGNNI